MSFASPEFLPRSFVLYRPRAQHHKSSQQLHFGYLFIYLFDSCNGLETLYCQLFCLSLAAHTPDNSFMGFVAEELNETERLNIQKNKVKNMAVVYGKEANMWKVSISSTSINTQMCLIHRRRKRILHVIHTM